MQRTAAILRLRGPVFDDQTAERLELETTTHRNSGLVVEQQDDRLTILFTRAKSAIICAIELQRLDATSAREKGLPMLLGGTIGFGPINIDEDVVSGDAVEIADNLMSVMKPGDVLVSGGCRELLGESVPVGYEPLRDDPATGYRVIVDENEILSAIKHKNPVPPDWSWKIALPMVGVLLVIGFSWIWFNMPKHSPAPAKVQSQQSD